MSYTTLDKVAGYVAAALPQGFNTTRTPNASAVTEFITEISGEIDAALGAAGYSIPATEPASFLAFLTRVANQGTAALVLRVAFPETQHSENGGPIIPAWALYEKEYQDNLKALRSRELTFPGAPMGNATLAATYLTDNPDSDPLTDGSADGQQPIFSTSHTLREF